MAIKNISEATITKGKKILEMLKQISIATPTNILTTPKKAGTKKEAVLNKDLRKLTSNYYSYIPRSSVINEAFILLDSQEKIQKELEILKSLESIRVSAIFAKEIDLQDNGHDVILKKYFKSLSLKMIDVGMLIIVFPRYSYHEGRLIPGTGAN